MTFDLMRYWHMQVSFTARNGATGVKFYEVRAISASRAKDEAVKLAKMDRIGSSNFVAEVTLV